MAMAGPGTLTAARHIGRPVSLIVVLAMLAFLGVTALGGGAEMVVFRAGNSYLPSAWLNSIPLIDSWLVPGLVLGLGFGVGSLVTAYALLRRPGWGLTRPVGRLTGRRWPWAASVLLGIGMVTWISLELIYLPNRSWLEVVYGSIGILLTTVPWSRSIRAYLRTAPGRRLS
jgi:hypothetical protein